MKSYRAKIQKVIFSKENPRGDIFHILAVADNAAARTEEDDIFSFLKLNPNYTVKGSSTVYLKEGMEIEFTGQETDYKGQKQVTANFLKPHVPMTTKGALGWLMSKPVKGVGDKTIKKLASRFPSELAEVLNNPEIMEREGGLSKKQAEDIADAWICVNIPNEILELFTISKMTPSLIAKCVNRYGARLTEILNRDPWLLAMEISGMGFKTADNIARELGLDLEQQSRYEAAIRHVMQNELKSQGHTGVTKPQLVKMVSKLGILNTKKIQDAIDIALEADYAITEDPISGLIFDPMVLHNEKNIAIKISELLKHENSIGYDEAIDKILKVESYNGLTLDPSQREAAALAITSNICIITGGPGTGKSTTQKVILDVLEREKDERILLIAPTGRAAKRLQETTGEQAFTIHRALGFDAASFGFMHDASNPLKATTIIIDEFSMVDNDIAYALTQAIAQGSRVVIVGDDQQLPSVSQGQVLSDFINSEAIPVARLNVIHRQAEESGIINAAHAINKSESPKDNGKDVFVIENNKDDDIENSVLELINNILPAKGIDINNEVMILTPMRKNHLGATHLNDVVKASINPPQENNRKHSVEIKGKWYSVKDRVMHLRNDYEKEVFNGTIGKIEKIEYDEDDPIIVVDYGDLVARYTEKDISDIDHCWASTVHKVQGSETRVAIIVSSMSHSFMLNKNLIYTAATRPKELCYFVGNQNALNIGVRKTEANRRSTSLLNQIRNCCGLELKEIDRSTHKNDPIVKQMKPKLNIAKMSINLPKL